MICTKTSITARTFTMTVTLMLLFLMSSASAVPQEEWNRTYGGAYWDEAYSVQQVPDGGYIIEGSSNPFGGGDYGYTWLIKIDGFGHEQWNRTFGVNRVDKISPASDGGYTLTGWSGQDFWIIEIDSKGLEKWNKTASKDIAPLSVKKGKYQINSVEETADGGFIYAGLLALSESHADWHVRLVKVDANGNEQWNMTSKRLQGDFASSVQQTSDGGYIVAGATESGNSDALIIKMDANGNQQWDKTFGGSGVDEAWSIRQTSDGTYIFAGNTNSYGAGNSDGWLVKMDVSGNEQWNRTFGGSNSEIAYSIQKASDGGYILAGYTKSYGIGDRDAWLIKTDANGNQMWNKVFGGAKRDEAYSVKETSDGSYLLAGFTESFGAGGRDAWLIKIKEPGANAPASATTVSDINKSAEKSTPGFEILVAIISVALLLLFKGKRI